MSWSCESWELRTRTTFVNCDFISMIPILGDMHGETYRIVGLAGLAESLRCGVDLFDHLGEILVELVKPVLELLGEFVTASLLVECHMYN